MALATVGTAWCSYKSAAWTRQSNRLMNEYNALERRAGVLTLQGMQSATIHSAMFMQMLAAQEAGNEKLANFYVERFPPDVRKAYDAWLAQKPFENPKADPHPFVPNLYESRGTREAAELKRESGEQPSGSSPCRQYVGTIPREHRPLCDDALFANAVNKFEQKRVRIVAFAFAVAVFAFSVVRTALLPR